jgi:hypothetical protein
MRSLFTHGIAFDIMVEQFVRIKFGAVTREKDEMDFLSIRLHPFLYSLGTMHGMTIDNKVDLTGILAHQAPEKFQENFCIETFLEHHEIQTPLVILSVLINCA